MGPFQEQETANTDGLVEFAVGTLLELVTDNDLEIEFDDSSVIG